MSARCEKCWTLYDQSNTLHACGGAAAGRPGDEAAVARIKQAALDLFKNGDGPAFEAVVRAALASAEQHHQEEMARLHGGLLERHETELLAVERRVASAEQRARTQRDRLWCLALLPEGPEVIQRITTRFNASRDDRAAPTEGRGSDSDE